MNFTPEQKQFIKEASQRFGMLGLRKIESHNKDFIVGKEVVWESLKPYMGYTIDELLAEMEIEEKFGEEFNQMEKELNG